MRIAQKPRRVVPVVLVCLSLVLTGQPAGTTVGGSTGFFSAPFAEDPTFAQRPPQTTEESTRTPTAVHMAMLPDGRIVYWGGFEDTERSNGGLLFDGGRVLKPSRTRVLDLRSGTPQWSTPGNQFGGPNPDEDLFCVDQRLLADGRLVAAGGTIATTEADLSPATGDQGPAGPMELHGTTATRWIDAADSQPAWRGGDANRMHHPRWYPTVLTMPDGSLLAASGVGRLIYNNPALPGGRIQNITQLEVFDPASSTWTEAPASADISLPLYPRLHPTHDGNVLYIGAGMSWNPFGQTPDEALWHAARLLDTEQMHWKPVGLPPTGFLSSPVSAPLMLQPPYDTTRIVVAGGSPGPQPMPSGIALDTTAVATYRDSKLTYEEAGPLGRPRWFSAGVLLPSGEVVAVSGADKDENTSPGFEGGVRQAELFDPQTGTWTTIATAARDRTYHNSAMLLPDGRVLVGGHAPQPFMGDKNTPDNPAHQNGLAAQNMKDPSFEILTPPYLDPSRGPRPVIEEAPAGLTYAANEATFEIEVDEDAGDVDRVVLMRLPSTTHVTDPDQRGIELTFVGDDDELEVASPPHANLVPPGWYYLFAVSDTGVPSKAHIVQVAPQPTATGDAPAPFGR